MGTIKLTSAPTNYDFTKKTADSNVPKGNGKQLDLYSYTGRVKFFDKDKDFGYIQEIPDTKNLKNVVKEWRITAEQLGHTAIHRGDFVYFMKHGKTIGEISPINLRDLLKTPCPECGRRDYVPGRNSACEHCGHKFKTDLNQASNTKNTNNNRDNDPAFNCLVGTDRDIPCPVCGRHAWKRYGVQQHLGCRCCGSLYPSDLGKAIAIFVFLAITFFLLYFFFFIILK